MTYEVIMGFMKLQSDKTWKSFLTSHMGNMTLNIADEEIEEEVEEEEAIPEAENQEEEQEDEEDDHSTKDEL